MSHTYIPKALRQEVSAQAKYRCGYCLSQEVIIGMPMEIEHLIPEVLGGLTEQNNLWLACSLCNAFKGERVSGTDPVTDQSVALFNPRTQMWAEHFAWSEVSDLIIGKTAIGRATINALQLNRQLLVAARRNWVAAGWHPPVD